MTETEKVVASPAARIHQYARLLHASPSRWVRSRMARRTKRRMAMYAARGGDRKSVRECRGEREADPRAGSGHDGKHGVAKWGRFAPASHIAM